MFLHRKELIHPVNVGKPDARFVVDKMPENWKQTLHLKQEQI